MKWLLSLSPQPRALDTEAPLGKPGELERLGRMSPSLPEPLSCQTPNEGLKVPFKNQVLCLLKDQLLSRKRIGEGTDYRVLLSRFISFSVCSLCFSKSGFQSILSFDSPWLHAVSVSAPLSLPLPLWLFLSSFLFILPFSQFPDFAVTPHSQCQHQPLSLHLRAAKDLHEGLKEVWAGGEQRCSRRPHQPTRQLARGPARVMGGAQAQPHPQRRCHVTLG